MSLHVAGVHLNSSKDSYSCFPFCSSSCIALISNKRHSTDFKVRRVTVGLFHNPFTRLNSMKYHTFVKLHDLLVPAAASVATGRCENYFWIKIFEFISTLLLLSILNLFICIMSELFN